MARDIKEYVSKCELCAKRKAVGSSKAPLNPIPPPTHVWQIMAMDIMGPLTPSGPDNHLYILVMGEYLTRYVTVASLVLSERVARPVFNSFLCRGLLRECRKLGKTPRIPWATLRRLWGVLDTGHSAHALCEGGRIRG